MLYFRRDVPEVIPYAEPAKHIVRIPRCERIELPEVLILELPALAVLRRTAQVAVWNIVPVDIVPRALDLEDRGHHRVVGGRDVERVRALIPAQVPLQRGSAVSKQVVRDAQPRIHILPQRNAVHWSEVARTQPRRGWPMLCGHICVEVVEPEAQVERHAIDCPLILNEQAEIRLQNLFATIRGRKLDNGGRSWLCAAQENIVTIADRSCRKIAVTLV